MLQELLGAHMTAKGKKYPLLPPILFPKGSTNKRDVFLNPALVNVSFHSQAFPIQHTNKTTGVEGYLVWPFIA